MTMGGGRGKSAEASGALTNRTDVLGAFVALVHHSVWKQYMMPKGVEATL